MNYTFQSFNFRNNRDRGEAPRPGGDVEGTDRRDGGEQRVEVEAAHHA
jgi:hypothetical protein